ncbi:hypothetical protein PQG02_00880 [Nostoc sp. UHCC 0926]|nr:hypothetical protein PQG02_00880 [Nostoc sp. UHCC 0926]
MAILRRFCLKNHSGVGWGASALGGSADLFAQRLPLGEATGV